MLDHPDTEGSNASLPEGAATSAGMLQRQSGMLTTGPGQPGGGQPPGGAAPGGAPPGGAPPPVASPVQQAPQQTLASQGQVFQPPRATQQYESWRERWQTLAQHPNAGPWIKQMAMRANEKYRSGG